MFGNYIEGHSLIGDLKTKKKMENRKKRQEQEQDNKRKTNINKALI